MTQVLARELHTGDAIEFTAADGVRYYFEEVVSAIVQGPTTYVLLQTSRGPLREVAYPSELRLGVIR